MTEPVAGVAPSRLAAMRRRISLSVLARLPFLAAPPSTPPPSVASHAHPPVLPAQQQVVDPADPPVVDAHDGVPDLNLVPERAAREDIRDRAPPGGDLERDAQPPGGDGEELAGLSSGGAETGAGGFVGFVGSLLSSLGCSCVGRRLSLAGAGAFFRPPWTPSWTPPRLPLPRPGAWSQRSRCYSPSARSLLPPDTDIAIAMAKIDRPTKNQEFRRISK